SRGVVGVLKVAVAPIRTRAMAETVCTRPPTHFWQPRGKTCRTKTGAEGERRSSAQTASSHRRKSIRRTAAGGHAARLRVGVPRRHARAALHARGSAVPLEVAARFLELGRRQKHHAA